MRVFQGGEVMCEEEDLKKIKYFSFKKLLLLRDEGFVVIVY